MRSKNKYYSFRNESKVKQKARDGDQDGHQNEKAY
jgi:hypothetical protein